MLEKIGQSIIKLLTVRPKAVVFSLLLGCSLTITIFHTSTILQGAEETSFGGIVAAIGLDVLIAASAYLMFDGSLGKAFRGIAAWAALAFITVSYGLNTSYYLHHTDNTFELWELSRHDTAYIIAVIFPLASALIGIFLAGILIAYSKAVPVVDVEVEAGQSAAIVELKAQNDKLTSDVQSERDLRQTTENRIALIEQKMKELLQPETVVAVQEPVSIANMVALPTTSVVTDAADGYVESYLTEKETSNQKLETQRGSKVEQAKVLAADGKTAKEIAQILGVSEWTVNYKYLTAKERNSK